MGCKQAFRLCPRVNPHLNHSQAFPVCENTSVRGNPWCCLCERATVQCTMSDSVGENQVYSNTCMHTHTHTHTHREAKLITSVPQAQTEAVVLAANNSQFSKHLQGREGGREGVREVEIKKQRDLVFSSYLENNDTPGESIATRRAGLFAVKIICRTLSLLISYRRQCKSAEFAKRSKCRVVMSKQELRCSS